MPQEYENLYLNEGNFNAYDFSTKPGIVSLCLEINDLSDGLYFNNKEQLFELLEQMKNFILLELKL